MMGATFFAHDAELYQRVAAVLVALGAAEHVGDGRGVVQLEDEAGRLFTVFEQTPEQTEREFLEEFLGDPFRTASGAAVPDLRHVTACTFECRWIDMVVRLAEAVATATDKPTWVLDGDGVIWDAQSIDPLRIQL